MLKTDLYSAIKSEDSEALVPYHLSLIPYPLSQLSTVPYRSYDNGWCWVSVLSAVKGAAQTRTVTCVGAVKTSPVCRADSWAGVPPMWGCGWCIKYPHHRLDVGTYQSVRVRVRVTGLGLEWLLWLLKIDYVPTYSHLSTHAPTACKQLDTEVAYLLFVISLTDNSHLVFRLQI